MFLLLQTGGTDNLLTQIGDDLLLQADAGGGGGFQAAWAVGSNVVVGGAF